MERRAEEHSGQGKESVQRPRGGREVGVARVQGRKELWGVEPSPKGPLLLQDHPGLGQTLGGQEDPSPTSGRDINQVTIYSVFGVSWWSSGTLKP